MFIDGEYLMDISSVDESPFNEYKELIKSVTFEEGFNSLGDYCFAGCTNLVEVDLPESTTDTGFMASHSFEGCTSLKSITIPEGAIRVQWNAFSGCTALETVVLPDTMRWLDAYAFYGCSSLKEINIPETDEYSYIGAYVFADCISLESISIPSSIDNIGYNAFENCSNLKTVELADGITEIRHEAFKDCISIESVTIPGSVSNVYLSMFEGCTNLKTIVISEGVETVSGDVEWPSLESITINGVSNGLGFNGAPNLKTVVFGSGTTFLSSWMFENCTKLENVTLPDTLTDICTSAFRNCSSLKSIDIPESVTGIQEYAFYCCDQLSEIDLPENLQTLGESAFSGTAIESVVIPGSLSSIPSGAFSSAKNVIINDGVTEISEYAFGSSLETITIPGTVTTIKDYTFYQCQNLKSVTLGEGVSVIGAWAFSDCYNLMDIVLPDSITSIGGSAFSYCTSLTNAIIPALCEFGTGIFFGCTELTNVTIENGVSHIPEGAFNGCSKLTSITLPDSVTEIGDEAFLGCSSFNEINLNNIETIGSSAFYGCAFESIEIPEGVTTIANRAFRYCHNLVSVTVSDSVIRIEDDAFGDCENLKNVSLGDNLEYIGSRAFEYSSIESIYIPSKVSFIHDEAFKYCDYITAINVDENNQYYSSDECGVLFDKDKTVLILYPIASKREEYVIPSTVKEIKPYSLANMYLRKITFPDGLEIIGEYAFGTEGISFVGELDLPDTVKYIGEGAFFTCVAVPEITIPAGVESIGLGIVGSYYFGVDMYIEDMDLDFTDTYTGLLFVGFEGITRDEYLDIYDLYFKWESDPDSLTDEELERIREFEENIESYFVEYDPPVPGGTIYCHAGSTAEAYAIENVIDYELTHFFKGEWSYDWENYVRTRKCIHCDEIETEALEKTESEDIEIVAPEDPDTDFIVENVENTEDERYALVTESVESYEGDISVVKIFDISLKNNDGVHVQPDGSVKVKLPNDWKHENYKVFRINDDGTYTDMNAYREGSHIVFETDHFSLYVIVDTTEKHEHEYTGVVTTPATHLKEGVMTYTCSCGDSYTEAIEKNPKHHWELKYFAPTCTEDGYELAKCACGDEFIYKTYVALNHNYDYKLNYSATHLKDGLETYTCSRCGDSYTNTLPRKTEHYYSYYTKTTEPTCTEQGYTVHKCECGDSYTDSYVDALGHTRSSNGDWCKRCGTDMAPAEPDTSNCSCNCHKSGFMGFIYKIQRFFWKIFKTNKICACGVAHY